MRVPHLLAALLLVLAPLRADPGLHEGELRAQDAGAPGRAALGGIRVRYHISTRMGEPIQKFDLLLEDADPALEVTSIRLRAAVFSGGTDTGTHIEFSPGPPAKRGEWRNAEAWASPDWGRWLLDGDGRYVDMATAKRLFANGLSLRNLQAVATTTRAPQKLDLATSWRRPFVGDYGSDRRLGGLLPVPAPPTARNGAVAAENAKRGWKQVLGYRGDLAGEVTVTPAGLAISARPPQLSVWQTADALVLKGRFGVAKGTVTSRDLPNGKAKRVLDGAVDVELLLQLAWQGKTESCRGQARLVPGQQLEMAIRLPIAQAEAITSTDLGRVGTGAVTVSVSFGQRPRHGTKPGGGDPFGLGRAGEGPETDPFLGTTRDAPNPFEKKAKGDRPDLAAAENPFQREADGNAFERERAAEKEKEFLLLLDAATALLDQQDWAGAEAKIGQALAMPGHDQDKRAVELLQRLARLRHRDLVRFAALLTRLTELKKGADATARPEDFEKVQREAKAILQANPALARGLTKDQRALVGLVPETPPPAESDH